MISVITPAYNNSDKLSKFLESVEISGSRCSESFEVIVVDDSSTMDIKSAVGKFSDFRYIRLEGHPGPAAARNRGAREARGEYLIFFDSDVILNEDTLRKFVEDFRGGEAAVAGEYDTEPVEKSFFAQFKALLTESWAPKSKYVSVFALRAAGIKKDAFNRVGGFDEDIKTASVEDFEFGVRLAKAGILIAYNPAIIVQHHHPSFAKQMKLFYLRSRDWAELFLERGGKFDNWCASPSEGLASVSGTLFLVLVFTALIAKNHLLSIACITSVILYGLLNMDFLKIVYKRRGILFIPVALIVKLPLAVAITAGFTTGILQFTMSKFTRRVK